MCKIFCWILENKEFVVTSILSMLLIYSTIRNSLRQNKLQENINNQQSQLQRNIAERETKVNLYQYRMNCYLQIMEALDVVVYGKLEDYVDDFIMGGLEFVKKISAGRKIMLKTYIVSETIFDEKIVTYIGELYNKYNVLYVKSCEMFMVSKEEYERRYTLLIQKLGTTPKNSNFWVIYSNFFRTKEGIDFLKEILPGYEDCLTLSNELSKVFKPDNELFKLMDKHINMSELNEI